MYDDISLPQKEDLQPKENRQGYNPRDDQKAYFSPAGEKHPGVATEEVLYETTHQGGHGYGSILAHKDRITHLSLLYVFNPRTGKPLKGRDLVVVSKSHYDSDPDNISIT